MTFPFPYIIHSWNAHTQQYGILVRCGLLKNRSLMCVHWSKPEHLTRISSHPRPQKRTLYNFLISWHTCNIYECNPAKKSLGNLEIMIGSKNAKKCVCWKRQFYWTCYFRILRVFLFLIFPKGVIHIIKTISQTQPAMIAIHSILHICFYFLLWYLFPYKISNDWGNASETGTLVNLFFDRVSSFKRVRLEKALGSRSSNSFPLKDLYKQKKNSSIFASSSSSTRAEKLENANKKPSMYKTPRNKNQLQKIVNAKVFTGKKTSRTVAEYSISKHLGIYYWHAFN